MDYLYANPVYSNYSYMNPATTVINSSPMNITTTGNQYSTLNGLYSPYSPSTCSPSVFRLENGTYITSEKLIQFHNENIKEKRELQHKYDAAIKELESLKEVVRSFRTATARFTRREGPQGIRVSQKVQKPQKAQKEIPVKLDIQSMVNEEVKRALEEIEKAKMTIKKEESFVSDITGTDQLREARSQADCSNLPSRISNELNEPKESELNESKESEVKESEESNEPKHEDISNRSPVVEKMTKTSLFDNPVVETETLKVKETINNNILRNRSPVIEKSTRTSLFDNPKMEDGDLLPPPAARKTQTEKKEQRPQKKNTPGIFETFFWPASNDVTISDATDDD